MHPEIVRIGSIHLKFYGLALALSFLAGTQLAMRRARKSNIPEDLIVWLALVILVLAVAGSRALYVATHVDEFQGDWAGIFRLWSGGLTMYGGVIAAVVGGILFVRSRRYPVWHVADIIAPSLALGESITRIGCFLNGCCFGTPTSLPWGVVFPEDSFSSAVFGQCALHPSQIYSSLLALAVFLFVIWFERRKSFQGQLFWMTILLMAVARFAVDFTRYYSESDYVASLGATRLNSNQLIAVGLVVTSVVVMYFLKRRERSSHT